MRPARRIAAALALVIAALASPSAQVPGWLEPYREPVSRLIEAATTSDTAWERLAELTDSFGHRLSGSQGLADAIEWAMARMRADGFDVVRADPVKVPHWIRGRESLEMVEPRRERIPMLGLGMSVGTPAEGIEAELLVVSSFAELERRSEEARGRIVLFDVPYRGYSQTVAYRTNGAVHAARH